MIDKKLIDFLRSRNWWYDEESISYRQALKRLGLNLESDFAFFFLHAEDGPDFSWRSDTFYQICWHILNTDYLQLHSNLKSVFGLPDGLIQFSSLEGGGAYFYDPKSGSVLLAQLGANQSTSKPSNVSRKWNGFNEFAVDFFEID